MKIFRALQCLSFLALTTLIPPFVFAQGGIFTVLHSFDNTNGSSPAVSLVLSGNNLYGATAIGGISNRGTVFRIATDGTGFTVLHDFTGNEGTDIWGGGPALSDGILYGAAMYGGSSNMGTIFGLGVDGSGFTNLYHFTSPYLYGAWPFCGLVLSSNVLYGSTDSGGSAYKGTIYKINTDGTGLAVVHSFSGDDGWHPYPGFVFSGNTLYGMTLQGGSNNGGTIFKVDTDGTHFAVLHTFTGPDGAFPFGYLILSGDTLYGTAKQGGTKTDGQNPSLGGVVFKISTNGTDYTLLHSFSDDDGSGPGPGLTLSGNKLYSTTAAGGSAGGGGIFQINTDGTGFSILYNFPAVSFPWWPNGPAPVGKLVLLDGALYGVTISGGASGYGTVYRFTLPLPPQLCVTACGANKILSWPTNATGFILQSCTNLACPNWSAVATVPVVVDGQNFVTNSCASPEQQFFRLFGQ